MPASMLGPRRAVLATSCSVALALMIAGCDHKARNPNMAAVTPASAAPAPVASSDANAYGSLADKRKALNADAVAALDETYAALGLLAQNNPDGAADALARATGKLEVVLTADPTLALVPVAVDAKTYDVIATPAQVDALRKRAQQALDAGQLQDARLLIKDLASEHVFSVTNLPLATYPDALKKAAALIKTGHPEDAVETLQAALATLVVQDTVVPLPLVRAELLLESAQPAAEKAQRSPQEATRVQTLLAQARGQLDLAQALGYGTRQELSPLYDAVDAIEAKTKGQGSARGLFDRLKVLFASARHSAK